MANVLVRPVRQMARNAGDQGDVKYAPMQVSSATFIVELQAYLLLNAKVHTASAVQGAHFGLLSL